MRPKNLLPIILILTAFVFALSVNYQDTGPAPNKEQITQADQDGFMPEHNYTVSVSQPIRASGPDMVLRAQVGDPPVDEETQAGWWEWVKGNWLQVMAILSALLLLIETVVRITPTKKDDAAFAWLRKIVDVIIPNNKTGGGTHIR